MTTEEIANKVCELLAENGEQVMQSLVLVGRTDKGEVLIHQLISGSERGKMFKLIDIGQLLTTSSKLVIDELAKLV